jgi:hypothetical protein
MATDLCRKINDLLDIEQAVIPLNKFIYAPIQLTSDETDFVVDDILRILKKKCVEELNLREEFNYS